MIYQQVKVLCACLMINKHVWEHNMLIALQGQVLYWDRLNSEVIFITDLFLLLVSAESDWWFFFNGKGPMEKILWFLELGDPKIEFKDLKISAHQVLLYLLLMFCFLKQFTFVLLQL